VEVLRFPDRAHVFPVGHARGVVAQSRLLPVVRFAELAQLSAGGGSH
jgi:hypothetical protein